MIVAMDDTEQIKALEDENNRRIADLISGATGGLQVQFPPGTLDMMKMTTYLEVILGERIWMAREMHAERLSEQLDEIEIRAREAKIVHGTGVLGANGQNPPMQ